MSSGKKGKKKKSITVGLMTFLAKENETPTVLMKPSWADDMEDEHEGYSSRSSKEPVVLPTAPRAARDPHGLDNDVPTNPPYVAYLSNLPYEVDEAYLTEFFSDMKISSIRLPKESNKLKGFGYVEFEDRQSLISALNLSNTPMKARRVRIDVSISVNDDRRGGRMGRDNRRDTYDDSERTSWRLDWRSGPRDSAPSEGDSYRSRYDNREKRDDRDGFEYDNKPGGWRESNDRGRPMLRDRGGGNSGGAGGVGGGGGGFRADYDRDGQRKQTKLPPPVDSKSESRSRPKLQLKPRTKPIEAVAGNDDQPTKEDPSATLTSAPAPALAPAPTPTSTPTPAPAAAPSAPSAPASAPTPTPTPSTNIFGAAKPVDTTARDREIEERLAKTYAETKFKDEGELEKRGKDGTWNRRNGEGRDDKDKDRGRLTWRSEDDRSRRNERSAPQNNPVQSDQYGDSRGPPLSRGGPLPSKGPQRSNDTRGSDRERKDREKDDISRMPKAKDEQAPNFVASNKYSMLPDDVDPDNIDD